MHHKVPLKECYDKAGEEPVGTKWLEIHNGDEDDCKIRARLVAQELVVLETIVAATPPWEAKKVLLAIAANEGIGYGPGWQYKICFIDTKGAYSYAPAKIQVYIRLP